METLTVERERREKSFPPAAESSYRGVTCRYNVKHIIRNSEKKTKSILGSIGMMKYDRKGMRNADFSNM